MLAEVGQTEHDSEKIVAGRETCWPVHPQGTQIKNPGVSYPERVAKQIGLHISV